jgi:hypothetical protein
MSVGARFDGAIGSVQVQCPRPGVLLMTMRGVDTGELGRAPFNAVEDELTGGPVEIFIDARHARIESAAVSGEWAMFFHANRARIARVHLLTPPRFPSEHAELVRSYGILEDRMDLVTDAAEFERKLDARLRA